MAEEDCADTWEDLEDSGELDKRLKDIEVKKEKGKKNSQTMQSAAVLREDTNRTTYQPQVRILKRNTDTTSNSSSKHDSSGQQNKGRWRPLEEREAAYAEARMRIFGRAETSENSSPQPTPELYQDSNVSKQLQTLKVTDSVNVIRQPKGPDGSKGFGPR